VTIQGVLGGDPGFPSGGGGAAASFMSWATGRWYGPAFSTTNKLALLPGRLYFVPWSLPAPGFKPTEIALSNNGATTWPITTGHALHLAWFSDTGHWAPASLSITFGSKILKHRTTTVGFEFFPGLSGTVAAGQWWMCALQTGPATTLIKFATLATAVGAALNFGAWWAPFVASNAVSPATYMRGYTSTATTFAAIPATAPPVTTLTAVTTDPSVPAIKVKVK